MMMKIHYLYNYRRCPYAMRARMALVMADVAFECHDINFRDKPQRMLELSPKGTVPVLVLVDGSVLDESMDIVQWALPQAWASADQTLVHQNDMVFKPLLDQYKYASRHADHVGIKARDKATAFLKQLNDWVDIETDVLSVTDICIFPFIRQFANVDRNWFDGLPFDKLHQWLNQACESDLFQTVFSKDFKGHKN